MTVDACRGMQSAARLTAVCASLLLSFSLEVRAQTYSTNFDGTENPLSEGGAWLHQGLDWKKVQKVAGVAYGTQSGDGGYDDSYAYLSGFPADHQASAVIRRIPGGSGIHEVELLLRWSDSAHSARGYECLLSYDASYAQIVRWNGPLADFTYIGWAQQAPFPQTGDVFSAEVIGDQIIAYYNGVELMRATDSTHSTGNPGIGFYIQSTTSTSEMAFTSFNASAAGTASVSPTMESSTFVMDGPNPFRGETTLLYRAPTAGQAMVVLFDAAGRELRTLNADPRAVGIARFRLDGGSLASGVYFARLETETPAPHAPLAIRLVRVP